MHFFRNFAPEITTSDKMNKRILQLAVPSILANLTVPLVGLVDVAIAGHISDSSAIGGIAVGTMLFDLLYWNFGFLRVGTGGMTAQAFGRKDIQGISDIFSQSISISFGAALFVMLIGWAFVDLVMLLMPCSAEVESFARQYFFIRIWAAPATLSLMAFKGWFIGMQNTVNPMICDITVNGVNMLASYLLAVHTPLGAIGVAYGTVIAQYTGLIVAIGLMLKGYTLYIKRMRVKESVKWKNVKALFALNGNLMLRSLGFMVVYVGFTALTSRYGDGPLAVGAIMMKLFMVFSYFIDGFAYAGEALVGRFIGEQNEPKLNKAIRLLFIWCLGIGIIFTAIYAISREATVALITTDPVCIEGSRPFLGWLIAMPLVSCAAFMWDGIFIGATAGRQVRDCMLFAALGFVVGYIVCQPMFGIQAIYIAYFVHLAVRTIYLSIKWAKTRRNALLAVAKKAALAVVLFVGSISFASAQNNVIYEELDSTYMAELEQIMKEKDTEQKTQAVVDDYEEALLKHEMSFHTDGINNLIRGTINTFREKDFRDRCSGNFKKKDYDLVDNGLVYAPLGVAWGLKALGVESTSKTKRMFVANALALGLSYGVGTAVKSLVDEQRPNGTDKNSMPSGHVTMAFASATILHREYGYISPWISVGGYATATATQYFRLRHNEHWVNDIYMGAGIGCVCTNFAYFLTDQIFGRDGINRPRMTMADVERTLKYNARPTSFSLVSGVEFGGTGDLDISTTFTSGLEYSHFINPNIAFDVMGRTAFCHISNGTALETYHADAGIKYSFLTSASSRLGIRAFGGGRYLNHMQKDGLTPITENKKWKPECGGGITINHISKEKYFVGANCDYVHTFSNHLKDRWVMNLMWGILL